MIVYKGTNKDMVCTRGDKKYQYKLGQTYVEEKSKTAYTGLHCAENPLLIPGWYRLGSNNRYFLCEAAGSIDEADSDDKIACTELTITRELTVKELTGHGMMYMVSHPLRNWEVSGHMLQVAKKEATASCAGAIAIARGEHPKVRGAAGSYLGLIREVGGLIEEARLFEVSGDIKPGTWYTLKNNQPEVTKN